MVNYWDLTKGKVVVGKGECIYQEVVDDFKNTSEITILTFNLSHKDGGKLLNALSEACKRGVKAKITTNIPKRFPSYYAHSRNTYAKNAHSMIQDYLKKLDSSQYNMHLDAYFNFSNHSKIILTDNIFYCGSANYSDESENNIECGFISKDKDLIKKVKETIIKDVIYESIPYYEYNIAESIATLEAATQFCKMSREKIFCAAYTIYNDYDTNFEDKSIYRTDDTGLNAEMISEIIGEFETYENALRVVGVVIDSCYEKYDELPESAQELEEILKQYKKEYDYMLNTMRSLFDELEQLSNYDWEYEVMSKVNEDYGIESFDENLERYVNMAMDQANCEYSDIIKDAEPTVKGILEYFDNIIEYYDKLSAMLYKLLKINKQIDNTGY